MRALVIGYGSIGMRHARLLKELGLDVAVVSRRDIDWPDTFSATGDAVAQWGPDYTVVASRTHEHRSDLAALAGAGFKGTVLAEKPLFDSGQNFAENAFENFYVAYSMRFHPALLRFRELLAETAPFAVHAYVGQYLPDWRPDADYRKGYSAIKAEGGGVLRDLSHELDYLNWMLGGWTRLTALGGNLSTLEIDSDDVFSLMFETNRCPVATVQMNYLDDVLHREILALTDKGSIRCDLVAGTVEHQGRTETFTIARDDTYIAQHQAALAGETDILCALGQGLQVMAMIDAAEAAAADTKWVAA